MTLVYNINWIHACCNQATYIHGMCCMWWCYWLHVTYQQTCCILNQWWLMMPDCTCCTPLNLNILCGKSTRDDDVNIHTVQNKPFNTHVWSSKNHTNQMSAGTSQSDSESSGSWGAPNNLNLWLSLAMHSLRLYLSANPGKISKCDVKMYNTIQTFKFLLLPGDAILKLPGIIVIGDTGPVGLFILPYSFQPCMHQVAQPGWLYPLVNIGCMRKCNDFRQVKALGLKLCLIFVNDGLPTLVGVCKTW